LPTQINYIAINGKIAAYTRQESSKEMLTCCEILCDRTNQLRWPRTAQKKGPSGIANLPSTNEFADSMLRVGTPSLVSKRSDFALRLHFLASHPADYRLSANLALYHRRQKVSLQLNYHSTKGLQAFMSRNKTMVNCSENVRDSPQS
jgi:hypothetical protein